MTEGLGNVPTELDEAWLRLRQRWDETTQVWEDPVRWQFQNEFWEPLEAQMTATQQEIERLAHGFAEAERGVR